MNPFTTYRIIPAQDIIRANIHPSRIQDDVRSLLNALEPISIITRPGLQKATTLHSQVIQKLNTKVRTLDLLRYFGYEDNAEGKYAYQHTSLPAELEARQNATTEFHRFYGDLKKSRDESFNDMIEFLSTPSKRPYPHFEDGDREHEEPARTPPLSRSSHVHAAPRAPSPPRMPSASKVNEGNARTSEAVQSFKRSLVTRHGGPPPPSFIRRRLLLLLFKQKNPDFAALEDEIVDSEIDRRVRSLKNKDGNRDRLPGDDVYYECLLRANFEEEKALGILRECRPNLKPPPEPVARRQPAATSIENSVPRLDRHWQSIQENVREGATQMLLHEGDEWKRMTHVVAAIIELRQQQNSENVDDLFVSKMYRLIYSELSRIIRTLSTVKIEMFAYVLCKMPLESLEHLNIVDIRDIIRSCGDTEIREDFQANAAKQLALQCPICISLFPRSRMEMMFLCDHMCCLTCAKDYYRGVVKDIRDPDALSKLTCFQEAHPIANDVEWNFFQYLGLKLNQWFTDERLLLETYHENLFIATRDSKIKKCGNPRCVGFFDTNNNNRAVRGQCPHCQFAQCQQCCRKWLNEHTTMSCEDYAEWLRENDPDDEEVQLNKYLNTAGMVCPNEQCKAIYEFKAGGCEHFTCTACGTEFCRTCSSLFYNPKRRTVCPRPNCGIRNVFHAHCSPNCYREIRDATTERILELLADHDIDVNQELQQKPVATGLACPVEDCKNPPSDACGNRFCERCYKEFLCLFIWRQQIEPWTLYEDNNLRQMLANVPVPVPPQATREALIALARQHLSQYLGKPKKITRQRH